MTGDRGFPRLAAGTFALVVAASIAAPWLPLPDPSDASGPSLSGPSRDHWLGTDVLGRDLLARAVNGGRTSLVVCFVAVTLAGVLGGTVGMVAGYSRGIVDAIARFAADAMVAVPVILIGAAVVALTPSRGPVVVGVVIGVAYLPNCVHLARGSTRQVASEEFVLSAVAIGARPRRILATTIAPHVARSLGAVAAVAAAGAIAVEGAFGYLGLSVPPPTPTWGGMLAAGAAVADRGLWPTAVPAAALIVTIGSLTYIGDHLGARLGGGAPLR